MAGSGMAGLNEGNRIGSWAFLVGLIIAVIVGFMGSTNETWLLILVVVGLVVGILNVAEGEVQKFLLSGAVLIISGAFGADVLSSVPKLVEIFNALLAIFVPATIVVAIKNVFTLARR